MADRAPGFEQAAEDLECYNCGMKGHLFFACPEDTRRVPAGLEASRKRQASGNDYQVPAKRSKGPVVTHYPLPPTLGLSHISPPPATFGPGSGYEGFSPLPPSNLPTRPPYHQPPLSGHYEHYPPFDAGRDASRGSRHSASRDAYEPHPQGTSRAPPPEAPYRPPLYDQYDQYRSGSSSGVSYGRSYSAPDRYDAQSVGPSQSSLYSGTYRAPHQSHFDNYPRAPGVDDFYPNAPQPYPPPPLNVYRASPHYGYDGASSARPFTSGQEPPPPGTYAHQPHQYPTSDAPLYYSRYGERFIDRPSYESQRMGAHSQPSGRRSRENRHSREHHGRRMRYNSPKGRSLSERRFIDRPARLPSPIGSVPPARSAKDATASENSKPHQGQGNVELADIGITEKYTPEDFAWEEGMIFKELPLKITKDLIREPLPIDWTDEPMIPPKYGEETITSKYVNSSNIDDFALSVRETKAWQIMQFHPTFLPPTEVRIEKLWEYERALDPGPTYNKQNRHSINSSTGIRQRGKPWGSRARGGRHPRYVQHHGQDHTPSDERINSFRPESGRKKWDHASYRDSGKHGESEDSGREPKVSSPEPGEVCETDDQARTPTSKSATPPWNEEFHVTPESRQGHNANSLQDAQTGHPTTIPESDRHLQTPLTPPPPTNRRSGSPTRLSNERSSLGGPGRPCSRHGFKSESSSQSSRRSSVGSPLTPTEMELLGMRPHSSDSDGERESRSPQLNGSASRPRQRSRQRPAKLHAAYQRRW